MQCLILAGGRGTRMKPLTDVLPKALIPVAGRPFCDRQLAWLAGQGVGRVVFAIGHRGHQVRSFVGDGRRWGLEVAYADEGRRQLGTGGAVRLAVDQGLLDPGFLVLYGDSYLDVDVGAVWATSGEGARPLMCVFRNDGRFDQSNAVFEKGRVTRFEKGRADTAGIGMRYIDYGLSVLTRDTVLAHVPTGEVFDLALLYQRLAAADGLGGFEVNKRFFEIGSPQGLKDLEAHLTERPG
ncbi:MAG: sugar phosphate nucleotidyltransferase [Rhodospirillales bacterium]